MRSPDFSFRLPVSHRLHAVFAGLACCALILGVPLAQAQESRAAGQDTQADDQPPTRRIGEATATALRMQVEGSHAGPALHMLGPTSSLSWQRYLDSYKHPIPETFVRNLDQVGNR